MTIHVHIHHEDREDVAILPLLEKILAGVCSLQDQGALLMKTVTDVQQLVKDLDAETNTIASKLDANTATIADLKAQIAAGSPVTQAQLDDLAAGLSTESDRLKTLGADPAQPIPPAPPTA